MGRLDGKVAFISGAARGQGRAHAVRLAAEGADIVAVDVCAPIETVKYRASTSAELSETAALVEKQGRRVFTAEADVRDLEALQAAVDGGVGALGRLDVVVANAGIFGAGLTWELTPEQWRTVIDVNLTGTWNTVKATVPTLISQGQGGSMILTSSTAGVRGQAFTAHYTAAKHGIVGLCRCLANELGEHDIRVNTIHPAGVNTAMIEDPDLFGLIQRYDRTLGPLFMNTLPYSLMEPDDVSRLVAFLASDESRYMTGAQLPLDFGATNR